ncbi:MAG: sigma factor G inhibitor Gin [Bacillota bacterium]|nr:sigma factor G inhibitor Gin [Bacillota bacterium]
MAGGTKGRSVKRRCLACGRYRVRGTVIRRVFLCRACEERLLTTGVNDPEYDHFVAGLRKVWPEFR